MPLELTAVFRKVPEGYIASVEELPGANTQGRTLEEARENLREAIVLVIEANRRSRASASRMMVSFESVCCYRYREASGSPAISSPAWLRGAAGGRPTHGGRQSSYGQIVNCSPNAKKAVDEGMSLPQRSAPGLHKVLRSLMGQAKKVPPLERRTRCCPDASISINAFRRSGGSRSKPPVNR
jgi:predicted RNase H-like HicB family nuclease